MAIQLRVALWQHQRAMVDFACETPAVLWAAGVGTGKTLSAIEVARRVNARRILVITLKNARTFVWAREIDANVEGLKYFVVDGKNAQTKIELTDKALKDSTDEPIVIITNYETARALPLARWNFDLAIADESHMLQAYDSVASNKLAQECWNIPHKIAMTGTPYSDRPLSVYGQMRWLYPDQKRGNSPYLSCSILGSYTNFFRNYTISRMVGVVPIVEKYINQEGLSNVLRPYVLHVDRHKVLTLPEKQHVEIFVDPSPAQRKAMAEMHRELITHISDKAVTAANVMVRSGRLMALANGHSISEDGVEVHLPNNPKADAVEELVTMAGIEPVVIFTTFKADITALYERLVKKGLTVSRLSGDYNEFVTWDAGNTQILIANYAAGSAALKMTRARITIFFGMGNSQRNLQQAMGRTDRPGADTSRSVVYYYVLLRDSIDILIKKAHNDKHEWSQYLLDNVKQLGG
jgi:hypothetical protein